MIGEIRKLIKDAKWEFKTLEEIATDVFKGSASVREKYLGQGNHPVIRNTISKLPRKLYSCVDFIDPDIVARKKYCEYGDIVISTDGGTNLARNCVYLGKDKCIVGDVFAIKHNEDPNFLSWALNSSPCKKQIRKCAKGFAWEHVDKNDLIKTKVPIPPRHIQEWIANFLDELEENWKSLSDRITTEIEHNQRRHKHYRDYLLWSGEVKALEEVITDIYRGNEATLNQLGTGSYPVIRNTLSKLPRKFYECVDFVDPSLIKNKKYCEFGDIIFSITGAGSVGRNCVYLGNDKCIVGNDLAVIKHGEDPNFLSHVLLNENTQRQIRKCSKRAGVSQIKPKHLIKIQVPIVPKEDQSEVADILDELFEVSQQLERELERELELRRIQFKFLRDSLIWDELPPNF